MATNREANVPENKNKAIDNPLHDRVAMATRYADGTPAQTADFEYIGDRETAIAAAKTQLAQQAVSATDVAMRTAAAATDEGNEPDPGVSELIEAHERATKSAERAAEAEVKARS